MINILTKDKSNGETEEVSILLSGEDLKNLRFLLNRAILHSPRDGVNILADNISNKINWFPKDRAKSARKSKYKQIDLEEAIENEKKTKEIPY